MDGWTDRKEAVSYWAWLLRSFRSYDADCLVAWRHSVGIGSDFDGIETVPKGMEDVSKYPNLVRRFSFRRTSKSNHSLASYSLQSSYDEEAGPNVISRV